jgi:hypothetical protein
MDILSLSCSFVPFVLYLLYNTCGGASMLCSETGEHQAIRFEHLDMKLARDIDDALGAIAAYGHGDGDIHLPVRKGKVSIIDFLFRKFREKKSEVN